VQVDEQTLEPGLVWSWRFPSPKSLREDGLEQYTAFTDSIKVGKYGEFVIGDEVDGESHFCALRKRAEIDACMSEFRYVVLRDILDVYYRQGLSVEHRGWTEAARRVRVQGVRPRRCPGAVRCRVADTRFELPTCEVGRGCLTDYDTFEVQVSLAIERLWRVHEGRYQRKD
jgi:hypothetical protein